MDAVEFLLENGADVNTKTKKNFTLLMYCVKHANFNLVQLVIKHGASINTKDISGFTALDYAVDSNNLEIVQLLVDSGAFLSDNSYMLAITQNYKKITRYFDELDPNKEVFLKKRVI